MFLFLYSQVEPNICDLFRQTLKFCRIQVKSMRMKLDRPQPLCCHVKKSTKVWAYENLKLYCKYRLKQLKYISDDKRVTYFLKIAKAHWRCFVIGFNKFHLDVELSLFHEIVEDHRKTYGRNDG